jgi:hypothetical protein
MNRIDNKNLMNFKSLNRKNSEKFIRYKVYKIETKMVHSVSIETQTNTISHQQFPRKSPLIVRISFFIRINYSNISKVHSTLLRKPILTINRWKIEQKSRLYTYWIFEIFEGFLNSWWIVWPLDLQSSFHRVGRLLL